MNYYPANGDIGWYVAQTLGLGQAPEEFYSNNDPEGPKAAYKSWVRSMMSHHTTTAVGVHPTGASCLRASGGEHQRECHTVGNCRGSQHFATPRGRPSVPGPIQRELEQQAGVAVRKQNDDGNKPTLMFGALMQVEMLANRRNTVSGTVYREDSAILAWELCNECQTSSSYEQRRGLPPGQLLYDFSVRQMFRCLTAKHSPAGHLCFTSGHSFLPQCEPAKPLSSVCLANQSSAHKMLQVGQRVHMSCNAGMN